MENANNLKYFNSEAGKNRDKWMHADSGYDKKTDSLNLNLYATGKFDDVIKYQAPNRIWSNAAGEEEPEDEDSVEPENEASEIPEEEFTEDELPKFRQLVRAKKLEMKAQYGKAHFDTRRECKMVDVPTTCYKTVSVPYPCPTWKEPLKTCYKNSNVPYPCMKKQEVCINIPTWVWGWRKRWREFKQAGGLAQLKMVSKGMTPLNPPPSNTSPPVGTPIPPPPSKRKGGRKVGESAGLTTLNTGDGVQQASLGKNIIGTVLVLGLVFAGIKMMK